MKKSWFILTSIIISLLVMLFSGSLQIMRNLRAHAPLDEFKAHMDERIPALMKLYGIPGCNIALVKDNEVVWTEGYGYADVANRRALTVDTPMSVCMAWGCGIRVLYSTAVVCGVTPMAKKV